MPKANTGLRKPKFRHKPQMQLPVLEKGQAVMLHLPNTTTPMAVLEGVGLIKNPFKKVVVFNKTDVSMIRTTRIKAAMMVHAGTHVYTSKSKLKSFLNKQLKLHKNLAIINKVDKYGKKVYDLTVKRSGSYVIKDQFTGKLYAFLFKTKKELTVVNKNEINPKTGKPLEYQLDSPRSELRVMSYPQFN